MTRERRWARATAEHERSVAAFRDAVRLVPAARWAVPAADGKWSPAEEALHVARTYEVAAAVGDGDIVMRRRAAPLVAVLSRWLLLPVLVRTGRFPRGVAAPGEVRPDADAARRLDPDALVARLDRAADAAARALRSADAARPRPRIVHAYFGPMTPLATLRLVSAHARHHARALARRARA